MVKPDLAPPKILVDLGEELLAEQHRIDELQKKVQEAQAIVEQATEARTTALTMLSAARDRMSGLKSAYEDLCVVYDWHPVGTKRD